MALNQLDELREALTTILEDNNMLKLYDEQQSFLWTKRVQLLDSIEVFKDKDLYFDCEILNSYKKWKVQKEERDQDRGQDISRILQTSS